MKILAIKILIKSPTTKVLLKIPTKLLTKVPIIILYKNHKNTKHNDKGTKSRNKKYY